MKQIQLVMFILHDWCKSSHAAHERMGLQGTSSKQGTGTDLGTIQIPKTIPPSSQKMEEKDMSTHKEKKKKENFLKLIFEMKIEKLTYRRSEISFSPLS